MATSRSKSLQRAFPKKELFRGTARRVLISSSLGSLLFCLLLVDVFLIVELLEARGQLELTANQKSEFAEYLGDDTLLSRTDNLGLLRTVWRSRDKICGEVFRLAYLKIPATQKNDSALMFLVLVALGLGFTRSLLLARTRRLGFRVASEIATRLRRTLHRQSLRLGPGDLESKEGDQVQTLFSAEVDCIRDGVQACVTRIGRDPFLLFLLLMLATAVSWRVTLYCLIPLAACWFLLQRQRLRANTARRLAESRADAELKLLAEGFRKTRLVRGFGMEDFELERFHKNLERFHDRVSTVKRGERWSLVGCQMLVTLSLAIVLFLVGSKVLQTLDEFSFASALLLLVTIACMHRPLEGLFYLPADCEDASLAADRMYRYLDRIPEVSQAVGAKFLQPLSKSLQFEQVKYSLPNKQPLLDGLDLKIQSGEVVAIVSLNPLESRAFAYLLPRFIEPDSGRILVNGEDIAWGTLESLRAEAIYVGGKDPFFTGTVLENVTCGQSKYSLQDVTEAAKTTHAHNFVVKLSQGYETVLGEHGEQLDAGQAFRLGLARAVLRDPSLLVIEEPTSPLDEDTKSLLEDAYNRITRDRTVIFLPSRLSTLRRTDRIIILRDGRVESIGKYAELVKTSQLYRHWEYVRFNEFRRAMETQT